MNNTVLTRTYSNLPFSKNEILKYARCNKATPETDELFEICLSEIKDKLTYKICYTILPLQVSDTFCDFDVFKVNSKKLSENLKGCKRAIIFAATTGIEADRLILKYGALSLSKALMLQAIGTAQAEALCDSFCKDMESELQTKLRKRFSPGYGDLSLEVQKDIFALLEPTKRIGVSLSDQMIMTPTKSVTAIAGICEKKK
jgi:hypothetical protein